MLTLRTLSRVAAIALLFASAPLLAKKDDFLPSSEQNPPPSQALSAYDRYELKPVVLLPPYDEHEANQKILPKIQQEFDKAFDPLLAEREAATAAQDPPRVLRIEPRIEKIRFISGGKRFWAGAFAGKSALLLRLRLVDAASGEVVAEPEFYQHAAAMSGAWSVGGADRAMLVRIASMSRDYVMSNRDEAVGGPTGMPTDEDEKGDDGKGKRDR